MTALVSVSPWNPREQVFTGQAADAGDATAAVATMAAAFPAWSSAHDRAERLRGFAQVLAAARQEISALLVREAGKTRADADAEADLLPKKIAVTLEQALARVTATAGSSIAWRARGVALAIGPYNFPLHLLHGLVAPALAVGCTVVAKPSERCPALGELYRDLLARAGLDGVCRVVQGGSAIAAALAGDARVATVAAVGSRGMGLGLAHVLAVRPETVLALELGGVNHALVCDDAALPAAVEAIADGAWRMAGQRCTATRIAHVPRALLDDALDALATARGRWVPGRDPSAAAGPMISATLREGFQGPYRALPRGIELIAGRAQPASPASCFADPLLLVARDSGARASDLYRDEHFGPALIVDAYDDPDECVARVAANPHRLAASVFTASNERFRTMAARLPYGQVNWNRPTAGARSDLPFGGCGLSGNGRPAAVAACQIFADETAVWE